MKIYFDIDVTFWDSIGKEIALKNYIRTEIKIEVDGEVESWEK